MQPDGDILDLGGPRRKADGPSSGEGGEDGVAGESSQARPWISIYFECCRVYCRIYRNAAGDAYVGWCPKCAGKVTVLISPDGASTRFFRAK